MKFRTEIEVPPFESHIDHHEKIITIGSCFAENIGGYFEKYKFPVLKNPFGVLYNTASILNSMQS